MCNNRTFADKQTDTHKHTYIKTCTWGKHAPKRAFAHHTQKTQHTNNTQHTPSHLGQHGRHDIHVAVHAELLVQIALILEDAAVVPSKLWKVEIGDEEEEKRQREGGGEEGER